MYAKLFISFVLCLGLISLVSAACVGDGGALTMNGTYCVHTFTTSGFFNVSSEVNVSVLVVGGGGAGASGTGGNGGGGGAGGLIYNTSYNATGNITVVVGLGGIVVVNANGGRGGNSSFGSLVAWGGGGGGKYLVTGLSGGSAGGNGQSSANQSSLYISGQGNAGGDAYNTWSAGGGGGASQAGQTVLIPTNQSQGGYGGNGTQVNINGTSVWYAGGGGGSSHSTGGAFYSLGGYQSGGNGKAGDNDPLPTAGVGGTGGGGGGGGEGTYKNGSKGGYGIVIVRYEETAVTNSCTYSSGNWIIQAKAFCNISSPVDMNKNNIIINGTGVTTLTANVSNFTTITLNGTSALSKCEVICKGGCFKQ